MTEDRVKMFFWLLAATLGFIFSGCSGEPGDDVTPSPCVRAGGPIRGGDLTQCDEPDPTVPDDSCSEDPLINSEVDNISWNCRNLYDVMSYDFVQPLNVYVYIEYLVEMERYEVFLKFDQPGWLRIYAWYFPTYWIEQGNATQLNEYGMYWGTGLLPESSGWWLFEIITGDGSEDDPWVATAAFELYITPEMVDHTGAQTSSVVTVHMSRPPEL